MKITDVQRQRLCELISFAFLEMRALGWAGKTGQAADLAGAFHDLSNNLWKEGFSLEFFRDAFLAAYHQNYPEGRVRDHLGVVNEILAAGANPSAN